MNRLFRTVFPLLLLLLLTGCGMKTISGVADLFGMGSSYTPDSPNRVARTAQAQIGRFYRFGGSSPSSGFDCSGLIWWAFKQHGIRVPRVTSDQARAGLAVRKPQPGDILVFRINRGGTGLHTGLYTSSGRFVHSPSSGNRVRMDSLSDSYWKSRLSAIRRIR